MFQDPVTLGITGVLCVTATIMSMHQVRPVALVSPGATRAARRATTPPVESVESDDEKHGADFFPAPPEARERARDVRRPTRPDERL
jgi:hypothetical protein